MTGDTTTTDGMIFKISNGDKNDNAVVTLLKKKI